MNDHTDIERVLERWFDHGPTRMPDRVVTVVADRIDSQRQRRPWRLTRRPIPMSPMIKVGATIAAAIIVVLGVTVLRSAPSGVGVPGASPTASFAPSTSPATSVAPSVAATAAWDNAVGPACGDAGCGGPLPAGTYASRGLQPPVRYTLTSPWVNQRDWHGFFMLYPDTPADRALAAAGRYPPYILILPGVTVSSTDSCVDDLVQDDVEVDAARFADFLATRDGLQTSRRVPVSIGGLDGLRVDVTVGPDWTGCLPGTPIGETADPGDSYRFVILDRPAGASIMIRMRTTGAFQPFIEEAMPVVESFEFSPTP